jgi:hypothetical protein
MLQWGIRNLNCVPPVTVYQCTRTVPPVTMYQCTRTVPPVTMYQCTRTNLRMLKLNKSYTTRKLYVVLSGDWLSWYNTRHMRHTQVADERAISKAVVCSCHKCLGLVPGWSMCYFRVYRVALGSVVLEANQHMSVPGVIPWQLLCCVIYGICPHTRWHPIHILKFSRKYICTKCWTLCMILRHSPIFQLMN